MSAQAASYGAPAPDPGVREPVPVITRRDLHLVAAALAKQSQRLSSHARSEAYAGPALAVARASLREQAERLAELAAGSARTTVCS